MCKAPHFKYNFYEQHTYVRCALKFHTSLEYCADNLYLHTSWFNFHLIITLYKVYNYD